RRRCFVIGNFPAIFARSAIFGGAWPIPHFSGDSGPMKSASMPAEIDPAIPAQARRHFLSDFAELVKARLTLLVLLTTAVGYYLGAAGPISYVALFHAVFGTALAAAGASALNQWWERRLDALMLRTRHRPIPAGRMLPRSALIVGGLLGIAAATYPTMTTNRLSAVLAGLPIAIDVFAYT